MNAITINEGYPKRGFSINYPTKNGTPHNTTAIQKFRSDENTTLLDVLEAINSGIDGINPELTEYVNNILPALKLQDQTSISNPENKPLIKSYINNQHKKYVNLQSKVEEARIYYLNSIQNTTINQR